MNKYVGSCLCGTVRFEVHGDFDSFYLCHCEYCQKDTGSAHAANLFSQSATLKWLAGADAVTTFTLAGTRHNKSFCRTCGSALPGAHLKNLLVVPAGCLDTAPDLLPTAHLFTASKAGWVTMNSDVPAFAGLPE